MRWFNKLSRSKKEIAILLLGILALSIYVYIKDPFKGPILTCIFNKVTGFYCPGCGMTRAVNSVLNLDFYQSFRFNALIWIMPITLGAYHIADYCKKDKIAKYILVIMLIIAIGYGVLRNTSLFSFLAPSIV